MSSQSPPSDSDVSLANRFPNHLTPATRKRLPPSLRALGTDSPTIALALADDIERMAPVRGRACFESVLETINGTVGLEDPVENPQFAAQHGTETVRYYLVGLRLASEAIPNPEGVTPVPGEGGTPHDAAFGRDSPGQADPRSPGRSNDEPLFSNSELPSDLPEAFPDFSKLPGIEEDDLPSGAPGGPETPPEALPPEAGGPGRNAGAPGQPIEPAGPSMPQQNDPPIVLDAQTAFMATATSDLEDDSRTTGEDFEVQQLSEDIEQFDYFLVLTTVGATMPGVGDVAALSRKAFRSYIAQSLDSRADLLVRQPTDYNEVYATLIGASLESALNQ